MKVIFIIGLILFLYFLGAKKLYNKCQKRVNDEGLNVLPQEASLLMLLIATWFVNWDTALSFINTFDKEMDNV